jgi:PEP-CTERM motif
LEFSVKLKFLSPLVLGLCLAFSPLAKADSITLESHVGNTYTYDLNLDSNLNVFILDGFSLTGLSGVTKATLSGQLDKIFDVAFNSTSVVVSTIFGLSGSFHAPYTIGTLTLTSAAKTGMVDFTILDSNGVACGTVGGPAGGTAIAPTPEPGSLFLLGTGLLAAVGSMRRRLQTA